MSAPLIVDQFGIKWTYFRNRCYSADYRGYRIVVRRIPGTLDGKKWRLSVDSGGLGAGIGLAFPQQFYYRSADAQRAGKQMVSTALYEKRLATA